MGNPNTRPRGKAGSTPAAVTPKAKLLHGAQPVKQFTYAAMAAASGQKAHPPTPPTASNSTNPWGATSKQSSAKDLRNVGPTKPLTASFAAAVGQPEQKKFKPRWKESVVVDNGWEEIIGCHLARGKLNPDYFDFWFDEIDQSADPAKVHDRPDTVWFAPDEDPEDVKTVRLGEKGQIGDCWFKDEYIRLNPTAVVGDMSGPEVLTHNSAFPYRQHRPYSRDCGCPRHRRW